MQKISSCGREFDHPIMNAAGTCKLLDDVKKLAKSAVSAVMVGSITVEPRDGNPGNVWEHCGSYTLNSLGLPNPGIDYYRTNLPEMKKICADNGKPLLVSVAGFSPNEYAVLAEVAVSGGADFVELNLGCSNVWGTDGQKPITSFDEALIRSIINYVKREIESFGVKLSPYSNPLELVAVASVIRDWSRRIEFVTTSNTFPNAYGCTENGRQHIAVGKGLAGFAGPAMKPIALGQVIQFRGLLDPGIEIIGAGGVTNGQDVLDYVRNGAKLVQVGSEFMRSHDPRVFGRILQEYVDLAISEQQGEEK
jgi:dihydroorotate dehydrogenase (fumarate)